MVGIQNFARLIQVESVGGRLRPRQLDQPLQVGALHGVLGRRGRHLAQAFELLARHLGRVFSHARRLDLFFERIEIAAVVALTQLVLDGLQLLAQDSLALMLGELLAYLRVNLLLDLDQLDLALQENQQAAQAFGHVHLDEKRGALFGRQIHGGRGDVAQARGILVLIQDLGCLIRNVGRDGDELLGHVVHGHAQPVDLNGILANLDQRIIGGNQERLFLHEAGDAASLDAPEDRRDPVLGCLDDAHDLALDANTIQVRARRLFHIRVLLRSDQEVNPLARQALDQPQRRQASDLYGHHGTRKQNQVPQRKQRKRS